jgi:cyclophilin family peptidyl-prolyl cis-trans isomerase
MKKINILLIMFVVATLAVVSCSTSKKEEGKQKVMDEKTTQTQTPEFTENPHYIISVTQKGEHLGDIEIELFPKVAPKHVHNFDSLVAIKFYDGTAFHRVIPGFMIQGGDPNSKDKPKSTWGFGDPSQTKVPAEFNDTKHVRGIISAARSQDPNSATSQFFIMHADAPHLDHQYTAYGKVVSGMDVVDKICNLPLEGPHNSSPVDKVEMTIKKK